MTDRKHPPCALCRFKQDSLWQPVEGSALSTLARGGFVRRDLAVGEVVFSQGTTSTGVYCVSRGLIALRAFAPDGRSHLLRLAYPGELIGYRAFLSGREHRTEAQALLPSRVCTVAARDAKQVIRATPAVMERLATRCADELDSYQDRLQEAATRSNHDRLLALLEQLMQAHGAEVDGARQMRLPISRQDISDMLGIQPETLSRLLKRLADEGGVAKCSGRRVTMPIRPDRLTQVKEQSFSVG